MRILKHIGACGVLLLGACQSDNSITQPVTDDPAFAAADAAGADVVYTSTNAVAGNAIVAFRRGSAGTLVSAGTFPTGGLGAGMGLGSQEAVIVSRNRQWLFTVNAGSDEVSVFRIESSGLTLTDKVSSGGDFPVSLAFSGGLLYVLNGGGAGNITGFRLDPAGTLTPLAGSTQPLSGAATTAPAQISFVQEGRVLVVTEKATNRIDTYLVGSDGLASGPNVQNSQGMTPFGFGITRAGELIVSEAFGGAPGAGTLSSYGQAGGNLSLISGSVPDFQAAPCWVVITPNQRFAYTTNTASNSISSYRIAAGGSLELLQAVAGETGAGSAPTDMAITARVLFALNQSSGEIDVFHIRGDGRLEYRSSVGGLPTSAVGLAL